MTDFYQTATCIHFFHLEWLFIIYVIRMIILWFIRIIIEKEQFQGAPLTCYTDTMIWNMNLNIFFIR